MATKVIVPSGTITVPGWIVRFIPPEIDHPDRSTASVVDGLNSSTYSAPDPATGVCWISLITMLGAALWFAGTRASLAKTLRRDWTAENSCVRWLAKVMPPAERGHGEVERGLPAVRGRPSRRRPPRADRWRAPG